MFKNDGTNFYRGKILYSQDYDFYLNLLTRGKKMANLSEKLVQYRINSQSISYLKRAKTRLFKN